MPTYPPHPAAELLPKMLWPEQERLLEDIKANGLQGPIVLLNGQVLDGRHRQELCELAKIESRYPPIRFDSVVVSAIQRYVATYGASLRDREDKERERRVQAEQDAPMKRRVVRAPHVNKKDLLTRGWSLP